MEVVLGDTKNGRRLSDMRLGRDTLVYKGTLIYIKDSELENISVSLATMVAGLKIALLLLLLLAVVAAPVAAAAAGTINSRRPDLLPADCGRRLVEPELGSPQIDNTWNTVAYYGQFPWQARLEVKNRSSTVRCGGVIITDRHVITAVSCVEDVIHEHMEVRVGALRQGWRQDDEQVFGVDFVHKFRKFHDSPPTYIALLRLKLRGDVGIEFGPHVQPACLPDLDVHAVYTPGTACEVSGWGSATNGGTELLRGAAAPLVSGAVCSAPDVYGGDAGSGTETLCAGPVSGGPGACGEDSGAPLVCRNSTSNQFVVFGVSLAGDPRGCGRLPGLYVELSGLSYWTLPRIERDFSNDPQMSQQSFLTATGGPA